MGVTGAPVEIVHNIIPLEYVNAVREYARGNLDEAELCAELTALGYDALEVEWHIAIQVSVSSRGRKWMTS